MNKIMAEFCGWGTRWPFGTLVDDGRRLLFEYSPEALAKKIEFSPRHLKLRVKAYDNFPDFQSRLPGLISDSLPDGWGLLLIDRFFSKNLQRKPHEISPLDRLAFVGERAMGAFAFKPAADLERPANDVELLTLAREVQTVIAGRDTDVLQQLIVLGGSPQGARPKALVHYDATVNSICTQEGAGGVPWLIKFPARGEHKEACAIEHCYAKLALDCGLDMPRTEYFELGKNYSAFGIERFDRYEGMRVPIHTLAGALHADFRLPSVSYQTFLRATRELTKSEREVAKAFERCVFNVVFNNRDDHTKNFSFRMDQKLSWKLAPCYDLTYSEGPGGEHQMDIEGEGRYPSRRDLLKLADASSLDHAWAVSVIERISSVAGGFKTLAGNYAIRLATRSAIAKAIESNRTRMA